MKPLGTIAFLARWPGVLVLEELLRNPKIELSGVYTHGKLPKAEGGEERPELSFFKDLCYERVPLYVIDGPALTPPPQADLIICLSWRFILPVGHAKIAAINIHRGDLPKYAGARPVERALMAGENRVAITAHHMTEEIDAGDKIAAVYSGIPEARYNWTVQEHAEAVKEHLYPLYVPLVRLALATIRPTPKQGQEGRG